MPLFLSSLKPHGFWFSWFVCDHLTKYRYHCEECGLKDDKGCCTLCALVCHRGHDVSYSRFSAFFCDCGAESEESNNCRQCSCLTALPAEKISEVFADGGGRCRIQLQGAPSSSRGIHHLQADSMAQTIACAFAKRFFPNPSRKSIEVLMKVAREEVWNSAMFRLLKGKYMAYKSASGKPIVPSLGEGGVASCTSLRSSLLKRKPTAPIEKGLVTFKPIMLCSAGTFNARPADSGALESLKRILMANSGVWRNAMDVDSRARIFMAESRYLLFCSLLPSLNDASANTVHSRASVAVLLKESFDFNITGVKLCRNTETKLLVWGAREAAIIEFSPHNISFGKKTELELGLSSLESGPEYVCSGNFLPGSADVVFLQFASSIFFFNLKETLPGSSLAPETAVKLGANHGSAESHRSFRGIACHAPTRVNIFAQPKFWTIFCLMEDGHLHSFVLSFNDCGKLRIKGLNLDPKQVRL